MLATAIILSNDDGNIDFKKRGVGRGHTRDGKKKTWCKKHYFERDLLSLKLLELGETEFCKKYAGLSVEDVNYFWNKIKQNCVRPKETEVHARNKLLLWLDKLHNSLSWKQIKNLYKIGTATAVGYVDDVLNGVILSYKNTNIITFPTAQQRSRLVHLNKQRNAKLPHCLFTLDGKHSLCTGRNRRERRSFKYKWLPCFNVLFVIERVFGTVCAFNLDSAASKHDLTILRESTFFQHIDEVMDGWIIMADKGYVGVESDNVAAAMKKNDKRRRHYSKDFWKMFNAARADSERVFAHFFYNKFIQLSHWPGKGDKSFTDWAMNVTCCIILYNALKLRNSNCI